MIGSPEAEPTPTASRRVLFLDDDPRRAELFLTFRPEAVWVTTAAACIDHLADAWDEVHLDHDLNGERFVDVARDDCGMAVVRWLCSPRRGHLRDAQFVVHSHNTAAATGMVESLTRAGYAADYRPFGHDLVDFLMLAPPPRGSWRRRLRALWGRLFGRASRLAQPPPNRYDEGHSPGGDAQARRELTSEEGH